MTTRLLVGPFNRVEGDLEVSLDIADGQVRSAQVSSSLYRGFENMLIGRDPLDALVLVPRICGICSVAQSAAAAAALAADPDAAIATACHPLASADEFFNSNVVKLVLDARGRALYFSRAPIPWARDAFAADRDALPAGLPAYRHIGLYAYRAGFLKRYTTLAPSPLEQWEALEQLRAMAHGYPIQVMVLDHAPPAGVDTADDLERVRRVFDRA